MIREETGRPNDATRDGDLEGRTQAAGLLALFRRHPVVSGVVIFLIDAVLAVLAALAATAIASSTLKTAGGPSLADFLTLCVTTIPIVILVTFLGWWRLIGFNRSAQWRNVWLLVLPAVVLFLPLVGGFKAVDWGTLVFLLVGYLLTGVYEETLFRGVILRILQPKGVWPAVLISSLLFGLAHATNIFLRFSGQPSLVALQMLGAFTFGIGMAALRLRTNTLWPLIALHAFGDLFLHLGQLPVPLMDAVHDIILLVYGLFLLLGLRRKESVAGASVPEISEARTGSL